MTDRGDYGDRRSGYGPRNDLLIERPEVFGRPSAAPENGDVDARHGRDLGDPSREILCRAFPLHPRRSNHQMRVRVPAPKDLDDVPQRGTVERRHDANFPWKRWKLTLPSRVEQPFRMQPLFELLERQLQSAEAVRL